MTVARSLFDAPVASPVAYAASWVTGTLTGSLATGLCVVAVALLGMLMLRGRLPVRAGLQVVVGCFFATGSTTGGGWTATCRISRERTSGGAGRARDALRCPGATRPAAGAVRPLCGCHYPAGPALSSPMRGRLSFELTRFRKELAT